MPLRLILLGVGLLRRRFELMGHGAGAQLAQVRDVVVEGARGDAEQFGNRGDGAAGVGQQVAGGADVSSVATVGRPPTRPRARAAAKPSLVPMMMSSRMNSASAAKTWKTSRPPGVVVSRFSCNEVKPMPRSRSSATMLMRSWRLRP